MRLWRYWYLFVLIRLILLLSSSISLLRPKNICLGITVIMQCPWLKAHNSTVTTRQWQLDSDNLTLEKPCWVTNAIDPFMPLPAYRTYRDIVLIAQRLITFFDWSHLKGHILPVTYMYNLFRFGYIAQFYKEITFT